MTSPRSAFLVVSTSVPPVNSNGSQHSTPAPKLLVAMWALVDHPILLSLVCFVVIAAAGWIGHQLRRKAGPIDEDDRSDLSLIVTATLTLLGLIIGFTFSMAVTRYDLRKHSEADEANSIGTEYNRAYMLPQAESVAVHDLLNEYLGLRIQFYEIRHDPGQLNQVEIRRDKVQKKMWEIVASVGESKPTATIALVVAGMNQVIDNQGYAQAAWWNRIPRAAWILMVAIAVCSNFLVGCNSCKYGKPLYLVLPLAIAVSFMLIADIDSPRNGVIFIRPDNLRSLSETMGK